ncbi:alpha/beta-hydrolase [Triangularia verruculosa]|uniref:Alpha/beta-hydrolase n=1 Tax=Triangularia verruculosa TaxID=2587418 RepID=A0AAN6X9X6_9PEZI|nr:alpha/beta-hydrolase [Triangularia verruculosa]
MAGTLPPHGRLVNIGTHNLALYTHGPKPKSSTEPVVLFISGVASDALNWQAVVRQLSPLSIRTYTYDRSGYNNSEDSPLVPTAENVALELSLLIEKAPITNPLILVGHSWAGVLTLEYIHLKGVSRIAGLVLVDANHETAPLVMDVADPVLWKVAEGCEPYNAWGVEAEHKLTQEEWDVFRAVETTPRFKDIEQKEDFGNYFPSFEVLRKKEMGKKNPIVGDKPVYVIAGTRSRDWQGLYNAGVAKGQGTEEERAHVRKLIQEVDAKNEALMKEFLKMSTKSELVFARESGHFVQMTQPEVVVDGVRWVLENLPKSA